MQGLTKNRIVGITYPKGLPTLIQNWKEKPAVYKTTVKYTKHYVKWIKIIFELNLLFARDFVVHIQFLHPLFGWLLNENETFTTSRIYDGRLTTAINQIVNKNSWFV